MEDTVRLRADLLTSLDQGYTASVWGASAGLRRHVYGNVTCPCRPPFPDDLWGRTRSFYLQSLAVDRKPECPSRGAQRSPPAPCLVLVARRDERAEPAALERCLPPHRSCRPRGPSPRAALPLATSLPIIPSALPTPHLSCGNQFRLVRDFQSQETLVPETG